MTPAIRLLEKRKVKFLIHRYEHEREVQSFGEETAEKLGVDRKRLFKTMVSVCDNSRMVMAVIPVAGRLDLKKLASALNCRKADLAEPDKAEKATGYVVGGISPLGSRRTLPVFLDQSAMSWPTIFVSAGRRGMQIELSPGDLVRVSSAELADITSWHD